MCIIKFQCNAFIIIIASIKKENDSKNNIVCLITLNKLLHSHNVNNLTE